jgi:Tfp pilus assembly protein PilP
MRLRVEAVALGLALGLCVLAGCEEKKALGPTTKEFDDRRAAVANKLEAGKGGAPAAARPAQPPGGAAPAATATAFPAESGDFTYDANGRRDPFRSYEWEYMKRELADASESGPLEQYDLSQLSVIGIVWNVGRARALVKDPSGMSYVVAQGARMGKNDGTVLKIDDNLMVVRERYVDLYGNQSTQDVEMRIRASDGG